MSGASSSRASPTHFRPPASPASASSPTSFNRSAGILRIQQELRALFRDPVPFIYVDPDESDITKITALIVGPLETPYAGGLFRFHLRFASDYPMKPPKVTFATTDAARVRFNPNLYSDGNVCLSILGTWVGPAWSCAESLSSVLLSIQSLMCPQPYHNEPGFESRGDPSTKAAYNDYIRYETLRVAVLKTMTNPAYRNYFPHISDRLFLLFYQMYHSMASDLHARLQGKTYNDPFSPRTGRYNLVPIIDGLATIKHALVDRMTNIHIVPVGSLCNPALLPLQQQPSTSSTSSTSPPLSETPTTHTTSSNSSPAPSKSSPALDDTRIIPIIEPTVSPTNAPCPNPRATTSYAIERLQDDYRHLMRSPTPSGSASPRQRDNPFIWDATILGLENTPWEGGLFSLELRFSYRHPHMPPFARFVSKMFHPNITDDGVPALDLIQTRWDPNTKVSVILDELQRLLASPSSIYPINMEVAQLYRTNKRDYERRVRRLAQDGM